MRRRQEKVRGRALYPQACALEPLDFNVFLPPQSIFEVDAPEAALDDPPEDVFLSLPHADNTSEPAASRLTAAPSRLSFTELLEE